VLLFKLYIDIVAFDILFNKRTYISDPPYLLKDEDFPVCIPCNFLLTVECIRINCVGFDVPLLTSRSLPLLYVNIRHVRLFVPTVECSMRRGDAKQA